MRTSSAARDSEPDGKFSVPVDECIASLAELSIWTIVSHCLAAARMVENRVLPGDEPESVLVLPFVDCDGYQPAFLDLLEQGFRDGQIDSATMDCTYGLMRFGDGRGDNAASGWRFEPQALPVVH